MLKTIDAKGKNCPMPVIMAKKEIDAGEEKFIVKVDNQTAVNNLKKLAGSMGYSICESEIQGGFALTFEKSEKFITPVSSNNNILFVQKDNNDDYMIFVQKDIIGANERELGESLIKMFFYTIDQGDNLPSCIAFMNEGVKLVTQNKQTIEHLKSLEQKGVSLMVCGACLNYYNLSDELAVGTVSNMYDIVTCMQKSGKVITI